MSTHLPLPKPESRPALDVTVELDQFGGMRNARVLLGGMDITRHVRGLDVESRAGEPTRVTLDLTNVRVNRVASDER